MKTLILLLITATTFGQGIYVGVGTTNEGALFQAGYVNKISIEASYKKPFTSNVKAKVAALQLGYRIELLKYLSITPSAGIANVKYQDFTGYDLDRARHPIVDVNEFKPVGSVSLDYTIFFVNVNYCDGVYYGGGIRVYFSKL